MNGITIDDICEDSVMYKAPYYFIDGNGGCVVFKKLKIEKI